MSNRILIVDDEPASITLLKAYLIDITNEILGVTDSRAAEQAVTDFDPDLVLLDLHMPAPDGLEVLRRLHNARESHGFLPVIVLTADVGQVPRNRALDLGANDFLTKPLDRLEVVLRVRNLLRTRHLFLEVTGGHGHTHYGKPDVKRGRG